MIRTPSPEPSECECGIRHPITLPLPEPRLPTWRRRATAKDLTGQLRDSDVQITNPAYDAFWD